MAEPLERQQAAALAAELQDAFFSAPNEFRFDPSKLQEGGPINGGVFEALRRHRQGDTDRPVLFPFRLNGGDRIVWYAASSNEAIERALESEIAAFLGPSYVEVAPFERSPDSADEHALPLMQRANWRALRFQAPNVKAEQAVMKQWQTYSRLIDRRPKAAAHITRSFEQERAAFDRALLARQESGALAAMASLRERFGLSAENRLYLEIRLAAAFERWDDIANHRLLSTLVHLNLPPETYGDVMEAIYNVEIRPYENAPRIEELITQFRQHFIEVARPLFRTRRTSRRSAVFKAFLLHELGQESPKAEACQELLRQLPVGSLGGLDSAVRARVAELARVDGYAPAQQALDREEFDRAYDLLWALADEARVLLGLVLCARESEDPFKARAVLERLEATPEDTRATVAATSPGRLEKLRKLADGHVAHALRLSDQFQRAEGETLDTYVDRWRELARSTAPSQVLGEAGVADAAAECLLRQAVDEPEVFERTFPLWHELFVERIDPHPRLLPVYEALLETMRLRPFTDTELELLHHIVMALVHAGAGKAQYGKALDEVQAVFWEVRSPHVLTWALNLCDALALAPSRDPSARLRLLSGVVQACAEFRARLTSLEWGLLKMLCREEGIDCPSMPVEAGTRTADASVSLNGGGLVALYSLDEASIRRATQLLQEMLPGLKVESNADEVCTPRLKALAHSADIFVFAWKSSKHAAYDCVKAALKAKDVLVMAAGAGTTSLVAAAIQRIKK